MAGQRWKLGAYDLIINPSEDSRELKQTSSSVVNTNGTVSTNNDYYDKLISFTINLYDNPTKLGSILSNFSADTYSSITEKAVSGELFMLRGTSVDIFSKDTKTVSRTFSVDLASGNSGVAICHMDTQLAVYYANGTLAFCDENGTLISKYTYTGDMIDVNSIAYNLSDTIYALNKYGRIYAIKTSDGTSSLSLEFDDFSNNQTSSKVAYTSLHYNGNVGYFNNNYIRYLDSNFNVLYGVEIKYPILSLSYGRYSGDYVIMSTDKISYLMLNTCGLDIEKIKNQISAGMTTIVDDSNISNYFMCSSIGVKRLRNLQDSRYEITLQGRLT